ncbi:hypothetical protein BGP77_15840 [Saccharospirillum sp. MSK14-1]|uniref:GNAT family N-acetyltransferase n=1 Tax=Saccharospirillum sp. MSK14-1 TaxID=1897632 RepID=UPI000D40F8C6|nr:GNAT family N-acetyltransferase [Saccharospirillum sp. MSK14-1]PTY37930.1 hypothetical protein BGP77_15840 [Saccharospirillum sp. MSK14-1]
MLRQPQPEEMDRLYQMGYDAWGDGDDMATHLRDCRTSEKYASGEWFVWDHQGQAVASLIVFHDRYRLPGGCYGIAAVATDPDYRRQGYASDLVNAVVAWLIERNQARAVYLHSDIDPLFYRRLGFECVATGSCCMVRIIHPDFSQGDIPDYF